MLHLPFVVFLNNATDPYLAFSIQKGKPKFRAALIDQLDQVCCRLISLSLLKQRTIQISALLVGEVGRGFLFKEREIPNRVRGCSATIWWDTDSRRL